MDKKEKRIVVGLVIFSALVIGLIITSLQLHKCKKDISGFEFQVYNLEEENCDIRAVNEKLRLMLNNDHLKVLKHDPELLASDIMYLDSVLATHYTEAFIDIGGAETTEDSLPTLTKLFKDDKGIRQKAINIMTLYINGGQIFIEDKSDYLN